MGWREDVQVLLDAHRSRDCVVSPAAIRTVLLGQPDADRIALARELLAGTGIVLATKSPDVIIAEAPDYVKRPLLVELVP